MIHAREPMCWGWGWRNADRSGSPAGGGPLGKAFYRKLHDRPPRHGDMRDGRIGHGLVGHSGQGAWAALLEDAGRRSERFRHSVRLALALGPHGGRLQGFTGVEDQRSKGACFRAGKMEVIIKGPYAHNGLDEDDEAIVEIVAACRERQDLTL